MKVLFTFGGMPHYLVALLKKLSNLRDIEIVVVIPSKNGQTIGKGVRLTKENGGFKTIFAEEYNSILRKPYFKGFKKILAVEKPDILVVGWPYIIGLSFDFKSLVYLKRNKIRLIFREIPFQVAPFNQAISYYKKNPILNEDLQNITPAGITFYFWAILLKYMRKWYYSLVDATLAYAECALEIQGSYGIKKEQIFISLNSPETDKLFEASKVLDEQNIANSFNQYRLIHVGRLVKWKRVDLIIDALALLKKDFPKAELIIIGKGPEEDALKQQISQNNLEDSVIFKGAEYDANKLGMYLKSSGIYVLAGMGGLSINEAMAFGKPIICSICDGTEKTLVRDGYNGLYFKNGDVTSLYEKIHQLYFDIEKINIMGLNSEKIIREEINLDSVASKFNQAFEYVLRKKGKILHEKNN